MSADDTAYIIIGVFFGVLLLIAVILGVRRLYKKSQNTWQNDVNGIGSSMYGNPT